MSSTLCCPAHDEPMADGLADQGRARPRSRRVVDAGVCGTEPTHGRRLVRGLPRGRAGRRGRRVAVRRRCTRTARPEASRLGTAGRTAEPARAWLAGHAADLDRVLAEFDGLVGEVAAMQRVPVITHGEPHPGNVMRSRDGLMLIDWDTVALAFRSAICGRWPPSPATRWRSTSTRPAVRSAAPRCRSIGWSGI